MQVDLSRYVGTWYEIASFWGDYWIVALGANYEFAVVGHPSRDYLWILSRTPTMDSQVYDAIVARLAAQGYETIRLVRTAQPPA